MFWKTSTTCLNIYRIFTKLWEDNGDILFCSTCWILHIVKSFAHLLRTPLRWQACDVTVTMSEMSVTNVFSPVGLSFCLSAGESLHRALTTPLNYTLVTPTLSCNPTLKVEICRGGFGLGDGSGSSATATAVVKVMRK